MACMLSFPSKEGWGEQGKSHSFSSSTLSTPNLASAPISSASLHPISSPIAMASHQEKDQPLPKFGEWDVNNPASAEGFTVIFNKARDEKKTGGNAGAPTTLSIKHAGGLQSDNTYKYPRKSRKWFCCG